MYVYIIAAMHVLVHCYSSLCYIYILYVYFHIFRMYFVHNEMIVHNLFILTIPNTL